MQLAHAALPRFELDGKRIAATSGVIALHVGVLMMLMMPAQAPTPVNEEQVTLVDWLEAPPKPPLPPPLPPKPRPDPKPVQQTPAPVPVVDPPPVSIDVAPSAVDIAAVDPPPAATSFDPQPASIFQQLATVSAPPPPYPRNALARRMEGTVVLRIHVGAGGEPLEVSVEDSSGSALLDQAALKFVKARWRFVPAQRDGLPTDAWALVPIEFVLN